MGRFIAIIAVLALIGWAVFQMHPGLRKDGDTEYFDPPSTETADQGSKVPAAAPFEIDTTPGGIQPAAGQGNAPFEIATTTGSIKAQRNTDTAAPFEIETNPGQIEPEPEPLPDYPIEMTLMDVDGQEIVGVALGRSERSIQFQANGGDEAILFPMINLDPKAREFFNEMPITLDGNGLPLSLRLAKPAPELSPKTESKPGAFQPNALSVSKDRVSMLNEELTRGLTSAQRSLIEMEIKLAQEAGNPAP